MKKAEEAEASEFSPSARKKRTKNVVLAHEKGLTRRGFEPLPADADEKPG